MLSRARAGKNKAAPSQGLGRRGGPRAELGNQPSGVGRIAVCFAGVTVANAR
jgi:hypothetical protein